jgi:hypothetical protein
MNIFGVFWISFAGLFLSASHAQETPVPCKIFFENNLKYHEVSLDSLTGVLELKKFKSSELLKNRKELLSLYRFEDIVHGYALSQKFSAQTKAHGDQSDNEMGGKHLFVGFVAGILTSGVIYFVMPEFVTENPLWLFAGPYAGVLANISSTVKSLNRKADAEVEASKYEAHKKALEKLLSVADQNEMLDFKESETPFRFRTAADENSEWALTYEKLEGNDHYTPVLSLLIVREPKANETWPSPALYE